MTIMMSDSLRDIVSIGQLTGESSELTLTIEGKEARMDLHSFVKDRGVLRCLAFSTRELILSAIKAGDIRASATFEGHTLGSGKVVTLGHEPLMMGDTIHDMLLIHLKCDN